MERSSGRLTSLAGLVVLLVRAAGLWEEVDRPLVAPKSGRGYQPHEFVQDLVWILHVWGRRLEDLLELRAEQEVLRVLGLEAALGAGTLGDSLCRQGRAGPEATQQISRKLVAPYVEREEACLDVDATEIEAEKQEVPWTYHHVQGYMPLSGHMDGCIWATCSGRATESRCGDLGVSAQLRGALPAAKRIYFRSNSAAYQANVINPYSRPWQSFTITANLDAAVKREIKHLRETVSTPYRAQEGIDTDREMAETVRNMNRTE